MSEHTVILVRHAKAEDSASGGDEQRELSAKGREQSAALAQKLGSLLGENPKILVSPATRAQQTWEAIAKELSAESLNYHTVDQIYSGDAQAISDVVKLEGGGRVTVVVGHEPTISATAQLLSKEGQNVPWSVPTATALVLDCDKDWKEWHAGCATFVKSISAS